MNHPVILSLIGAWLFATTTTTAHAAADRVMTVKASVNGMVCSFCAQGIVAHFKKHPAVSNVHVDLTRKLVLLEEKKGASISDQEITEFIKKSGFEPQKVERSTESFSKAKAARK
jgi:copper chaperone CopZ